MTVEELQGLFERYEDEFLVDDKVTNRETTRTDLEAFIRLDKLVPGKSDIISGAEHDEIFLGVELEDLAAAATEKDILDLIRLGVRYVEDGLAMYA